MTTKTGRQFRTQQTHYLRKRIDFNTAASGTQVLIGTLPPGAIVTAVVSALTVAFNAGTTNVLIVGTSGDASALVDAAGSGTSIDETAVGVTSCKPASLAGLLSASAEVDVFAKYTQTGTAATTGTAYLMVFFVPNNDG